MSFIVKRQNILSKTLTVFLLVAFIFPSFITKVIYAQNTSSSQGVNIYVPKIVIGSSVVPDLSRFDWDKIKNEENLQALNNVPENIKALVSQYLSEIGVIDGNTSLLVSEKVDQKSHAKQALQHLIAENLIAKKELPQNYFELEASNLIESADSIVNIKKNSSNKLNLKKGEGVGEIFDTSKLNITHTTVSKNNSTENITEKDLTNGIDAISNSNTTGIAFLVAHQNTDGSWGNADKSFVTTVAVLDALKTLNETGTTYQNGISWLESYIAENNDYLAEQIKIVADSGRETTDIMSLIAGLDENTGGFVFDRNYRPDSVTTAKALEALDAVNYTDSGDNPTLTIGMALYYLTQNQHSDGLWGAFKDGASSISVTEEVLAALFPHRNQVLSGLGSGDIVVKDYINKAISTLKNLQLTNGSWAGSFLNNTLAFYAMRSLGVSPIYQNLAISYIESNQAGDGSFGNGDLYVTAKAIKALSVAPLAGAIGDPTIYDITPISTLQTGSSASIKILITNHGNAVINTGILRILTDGYVFGSVDLNAAGIIINPNTTEQVNISLPNTRSFVGNVKFTLFIEGVNGATYPNSKYDKTLTFASDPTGLPGLPVYFIAQKYAIDNSPTLNVRWAQKNDPNRLNYLIMWRTVGTTTWSVYAIDNSWNGAFLLPFIEDQHYEVTVGAVTLDGTQYVYYNDFIEVATSGSPTKYSMNTISGSTNIAEQPLSSVTVFGYGVYGKSDENGNFFIENISYGSSAMRVFDFRYEEYWSKFVNSGNNLTNIKVYTHLKPDTQNPTVTNLAPYGYPNYQIPNEVSVPLRYTVDDDMKSGSLGFVKSAKLEYYDPHDSLWHLIGTQEGSIFGTWTYNWSVPNSLLGTGYQLRVIVRDFSGKESTPAIYGPFEILHVAPTYPTNLFVKGRTNPVNISSTNLNFSAIYNDPDNTDVATSYRIQVANSATFATSSLVWDSGKTQFATPVSNGSRSANIPYVGTTLLADIVYYWRIKFWDNNNNEGIWSTETSTFSITDGPEVCSVPLTGDWIIENNCTLNASAVVPANIKILPNVILTIIPDVSLQIDLKHYKLLVKKGGGILVKKGATFKQKSP
jgi:hypothetical protein